MNERMNQEDKRCWGGGWGESGGSDSNTSGRKKGNTALGKKARGGRTDRWIKYKSIKK